MDRSRQHPCAIHFIYCCGALNFETMKLVKVHTGIRIDNGRKVKGSLLYDTDQDSWRIATSFFDVPRPKTDDEFGVFAPEVVPSTIKEA